MLASISSRLDDWSHFKRERSCHFQCLASCRFNCDSSLNPPHLLFKGSTQPSTGPKQRCICEWLDPLSFKVVKNLWHWPMGRCKIFRRLYLIFLSWSCSSLFNFILDDDIVIPNLADTSICRIALYVNPWSFWRNYWLFEVGVDLFMIVTLFELPALLGISQDNMHTKLIWLSTRAAIYTGKNIR